MDKDTTRGGRMAMHTIRLLVPLFLALLPASYKAQVPSTSSSAFDAKAFAALPIEKSYTFIKRLSEDEWHVRRDAAAKPATNETAIPATGWVLVVKSAAGEPLRQAAEDLRDYLDKGMLTKVTLETPADLSGLVNRKGVIAAGSRSDLPGCDKALSGSKDYQITVNPDRIVVCGYDELGAMYGLYNLEERMDLRQAPYLPRDLNTVRHSLLKARMTLSGLGWMEWPDKYLATLPRYGFDSIFDSVYANPNGVAGPPPYWDQMRKQDPARLHDLVRRAARYGIRLYCPILYDYTGTAENEEGLRALTRDIVTQFPEIRGYVLLTEGFFYKTWFGAGGQGKTDLREWTKNWAKGVAIVTEECQKLDPAIEVLPWDYNIDFRPDQVELNRYVIDQLPQGSIPLVTFENGKGFSFDGERGSVRDYSISQIGPSEVAAAQIAEARKRGMRGMYVKADTWASWQFGTSPYLPFPYQWYARYRALEESGVDGTMESWSYGFKPNFVAEMRAWYSWSDAPPLEFLLREIAHRDFGAGSEERVLGAWKHFSTAVRLDPDTGPTEGGNNAVANPLFFEPPEEHGVTFAHSWWDQRLWSRRSFLNPAWTYTLEDFVLYPDFTNQLNVAERYAKPFTLPVFEKYLLMAANEMEYGLESYRQAALDAPVAKRPNAFREVLLAEQIKRMLQSNEATVEFEDLRFHLAKTNDPSERPRTLDRMIVILREEIPRTQAALETARRDSRLGYEWESDYMYWPEVLEKKLQMLNHTLNEEIPAYRRHHE